MLTTMLFSQKRLVQISSKDSPREQRIWRAKYNRFMRSRQPLIWAR